jgi:hypothetical protein
MHPSRLKNGHDDLFAEVRNRQPVILMSPVRKLELLTKANSKPGLFQPLSSLY